jgi:phosphorylcholine metabolism protein LicD
VGVIFLFIFPIKLIQNHILSETDSYNLYKLLHRVVRILEKNNITYWASGGTFLGAIRSKGIIKWDDDIDLCVLLKDRDKLKKIIDQENDIYLDLRDKIVNKIKYKTGEYAYVDIFFMVPEIENGQTVYKCALKGARNIWKNEVYLEKELVPLKKTKFGAMEISIPNEYMRYFLSSFGKNWNKEGLISYNHKTGTIVHPKIQWNLRASDYEPAKPFYIEESFENM